MIDSRNNLNDEEIIVKLLNAEDSSLFEILYDRYVDKVFAKCFSFTKEASLAEDLSHDIFIKVYSKLADFKGNAKFSTWLYMITYNHCIDYVRKNTRRIREVEIAGDINIENEDTGEDKLLEIRVERLQNILNQISIEERSILIMKYQDDFQIKEICKLLDINASAAKMRLKRAKAKVLRLYKEKYER